MHVTPSKPDQATVDQTASPQDSVADAPAVKVALDFLAPAQQADELGRLGHYRILKMLGKGGMGAVFLAEDIKLKRPVALKVMLPKFAEDEAAKQRFLREAQTAAAIEHDHIVHIYQVDEDRGVPFLAMQLLSGSSLENVLKRAGRLTTRQILRLGAQIAEGLAVAHAKNLIHRDIKPANIWIEANYGGRVKLLDFGLARAVEADVGVTQSGVILGTPAYMPPEQARGERVDHRCDLYSLGCVLYRMATGELPIKGKDTMALLMALALEAPKPAKKINPAIPEALDDLIMKLLAKDAGQRPESAKAVAQTLRQMEQAAGMPAEVTGELAALAKPTRSAAAVSAEPAKSSVVAPLTGAPTVADSGGTDVAHGRATIPALAWPKTRRRVLLGFAAAGLLACAVGAILYLRLPVQDSSVPLLGEWALDFDGESSFVELPPIIYDPTRGVTLEALVLSKEPGAVINSDDENGSIGITTAKGEFGFGAAIRADAFESGTKSALHGAGSKAMLPADAWVHLAAVFDGKSIRLYRDGQEVTDYLSEAPFPVTLIHPSNTEGNHFPGVARLPTGPILIGRLEEGGFFKGRIAGIRISNGPRSPGDFAAARRWEPDKDTLALFRFDEGQGDTLTDLSGKRRHGKIVGARWVKPDAAPLDAARPTYALDFDGKLGHVLLPALKGAEGTLTLEAWAMPRQAAREGGIVQIEGSPRLNLAQYHHPKFSPNAWLVHRWATNSGGIGFITAQNNSVRPNEWIHLAAVWDQRELRLYLDGTPAGKQGKNDPNVGDGPRRAIIGSVSAGEKGLTFDGMIREVRISKTPRYTQAFTPKQRFDPDKATIALYHFDEGEGETLHDYSGLGHHGKAVAAKWVKFEDPTIAGAHYLSFGVDGSVTVPSLTYDGQTPMTLEAWVRTPVDAHKKGEFGFPARFGAFWLKGNHDVAVPFRLYNFVAIDSAIKDWVIWNGKNAGALGEWTHLAGQWDGAKATFFVNGQPAWEDCVAAPPPGVKVDPSTPETRKRIDACIQSLARAPLILGGEGHLPAGDIRSLRISKVIRYGSAFEPAARFQPDRETLALYHFDEGQGNKLIDSSGHGHHGKIVGAKWVKVERPQKADVGQDYQLAFDGVGSYVEVPAITPALDGSREWTIEMRAAKNKDQSLGVAWSGGVQMVLTYSSGRWILMEHDQTGVRLNTSKLGTYFSAVRKQDSLRFFIDGKQVGTTTFTAKHPDSKLPFRLAASQSNGELYRFFQGTIDEVRISTTARYDVDYVPAPRFAPDQYTLALYHCDEGQGNKLVDSSGNNHHGKIVGAKWVKVE